MRRNLLVDLIAWVLLVLCSTSTLSQIKPDTKSYGGLLWKAEKENWTLYLYGVSHSAGSILELNSRVRKLIETSDLYVSEIYLGKSVAHPTDLKGIAREYIDKPYALSNDAEKSFRRLHTDGVIGAYQYWALRHQSPITATRGVYPELLYKHFSDEQIVVTAFPKPRAGPDRIALNLANSKKVNTIQIEPEHTADRYWLKNCDNERDNSAYLLSLIEIAVNQKLSPSKIDQQIFEGDLEGYQQSVDRDIELDFPRLDYKCHVIDRNKFWAQSIDRLKSLRPEKSVMFFTFGAAHAVAPKKFPNSSLIDLLRQQGWNIQWINAQL